MTPRVFYRADSPIVERLLRLLGNVAESGRGWTAKCPWCDHGPASLSIGRGADGRILLICSNGCTEKDILFALSLQPSDLLEPQASRLCETLCLADSQWLDGFDAGRAIERERVRELAACQDREAE